MGMANLFSTNVVEEPTEFVEICGTGMANPSSTNACVGYLPWWSRHPLKVDPEHLSVVVLSELVATVDEKPGKK